MLRAAITTPALAIAAVIGLLPAAGRAQHPDRAFVALELNGHVGATTKGINRNTDSIALSELEPFAHETALSFGIGMSDISSELALRVGYGFASGSLPQGSVIRGAETRGYSLAAVPLAMGWRLLTGGGSLSFFAGVDLGGQMTRMRYESPDRAMLGGDWSWSFGGRAVAGLHVDAWEFVGIRLYAEGRLAQDLTIEEAPDVGLTLVGVGLAVVAAPEQLTRVSLGAWVDSEPNVEASAPEQEPAEEARDDALPFMEEGISSMERASQLIRDADAARAQRDFINAERLYREAIRLLPRDPETRRNLEVPVRIDWAKVLIEVALFADAREVLGETAKIAPEDKNIRALLDQLN